MIIDTTISRADRRIEFSIISDRFFSRGLMESGAQSPRSAERKARTEYRHSAIRDFLIKQGKDPGQSMNYVAFWRDGKVLDVHIVTNAVEEKNIYLQEQQEKFELFMQHCPGHRSRFRQNNQRNQELSE